MGGAQLVGFAGRMKRIGEQHQTVRQAGFFSREHGSLAAAVRLPAYKDPARRKFSYSFDCAAQPGSIFSSASSWRPVGAQLPKGQVAAKDDDASFGQRLRERDE